jgi:hypothetical protein
MRESDAQGRCEVKSEAFSETVLNELPSRPLTSALVPDEKEISGCLNLSAGALSAPHCKAV